MALGKPKAEKHLITSLVKQEGDAIWCATAAPNRAALAIRHKSVERGEQINGMCRLRDPTPDKSSQARGSHLYFS